MPLDRDRPDFLHPLPPVAHPDLIFDIDHPMVGATIDTGHIRGSTDIGVPPERRGSAEARDRFNDVLGTHSRFSGTG